MLLDRYWLLGKRHPVNHAQFTDTICSAEIVTGFLKPCWEKGTWRCCAQHKVGAQECHAGDAHIWQVKRPAIARSS